MVFLLFPYFVLWCFTIQFSVIIGSSNMGILKSQPLLASGDKYIVDFLVVLWINFKFTWKHQDFKYLSSNGRTHEACFSMTLSCFPLQQNVSFLPVTNKCFCPVSTSFLCFLPLFPKYTWCSCCLVLGSWKLDEPANCNVQQGLGAR